MITLKKEFTIGTIGEYEKLRKSKKFLILRHDVDFSLDYALKLAKKEAKNEIKSTYFILLHGEYYNPFDKKNTKIIKEISNLGHEIGLHYDTDFFQNHLKKKVIINYSPLEHNQVIMRKYHHLYCCISIPSP